MQKQSGTESRIVNVASRLEKRAIIESDVKRWLIDGPSNYTPFQAYRYGALQILYRVVKMKMKAVIIDNLTLFISNSKLCNLLTTFEMNRKLCSSNNGKVIINAVSPGI
jgi:archaellum biogenesis ATPase FlaH